MSRGYENRHYYVKTENGITEYYAKYDGQSIRIEKELYDFLKSSYSQERELERSERRHKFVSIDQVLDSISQVDQHGTLLPAFQVDSAEKVFFNLDSPDRRKKMKELMMRKIACLPLEEQELLYSFGHDSSVLEKLADKYGITTRAMFYRRRKLADQIADSVIGDLNNETSEL